MEVCENTFPLTAIDFAGTKNYDALEDENDVYAEDDGSYSNAVSTLNNQARNLLRLLMDVSDNDWSRLNGH